MTSRAKQRPLLSNSTNTGRKMDRRAMCMPCHRPFDALISRDVCFNSVTPLPLSIMYVSMKGLDVNPNPNPNPVLILTMTPLNDACFNEGATR